EVPTMSSEDDELAVFRREQALQQHNLEKKQPGGGGLTGQLEDAVTRGADVVSHRARLVSEFGCMVAAFATKAWSWLHRPAYLMMRAALLGVRGATHLGITIGRKAAIAEDPSGRRYFSPWKLSKNIVKGAIVATVTPICVGAFYYYGTLRTYADIYVPNAG